MSQLFARVSLNVSLTFYSFIQEAPTILNGLDSELASTSEQTSQEGFNGSRTVRVRLSACVGPRQEEMTQIVRDCLKILRLFVISVVKMG